MMSYNSNRNSSKIHFSRHKSVNYGVNNMQDKNNSKRFKSRNQSMIELSNNSFSYKPRNNTKTTKRTDESPDNNLPYNTLQSPNIDNSIGSESLSVSLVNGGSEDIVDCNCLTITKEEAAPTLPSSSDFCDNKNNKHIVDCNLLKQNFESSLGKSRIKLKLNFLQESQLSSEQLGGAELSSYSDKSLKIHTADSNSSIGGDFITPSSSSPKVNSSSVASIENDMNCLQISSSSSKDHNPVKPFNININSNNNNHLITDKAIVLSNDHHHHHHPYKFSSNIDTAALIATNNSFYHYPTIPLARPIPGLSYTPAAAAAHHNIQPLQLMYGGPPPNGCSQFIRYPSHQNFPIGVPSGSYLVYNPVVINGIYNSINTCATPLLTTAATTNRFVQLGHHPNPRDIPSAPVFNISQIQPTTFFHDSSSNNSHIR